MELGAHLPLIDFNDRGFRSDRLIEYVHAARELGFSTLCANDHLVFQRPWLDGIVGLASMIERSGNMTLATTVSLPVVRGPVALAKTAAAIDILSGGRLVLGVGPGSSVRDYEAAGLNFDERWPRLDESVRVLRAHLKRKAKPFEGRFYHSNLQLEPRPANDEGPPIWIGSWGSEAGIRRVAHLGDGWLASAYNTTPQQMREGRNLLDVHLKQQGRRPEDFASALATMWTYITEDAREREQYLARLASMLNRPVDSLAAQVLIGSAEECAEKLRRYEAVNVDHLLIWPLADEVQQLEILARDVAPLTGMGSQTLQRGTSFRHLDSSSNDTMSEE